MLKTKNTDKNRVNEQKTTHIIHKEKDDIRKD